ncbi:EamA family transporter [Actinoplanes sp. CA-015351]|uniref:EamA family transporter n=1 Tax=Actinoplanes sp. CA-015351 TaxID=3239897 RepID=UPI003D96ADDB
MPLLGRHGPLGVSVHTTWMAAVLFGSAGVLLEGPAAALDLHPTELLAGAYLAVAVTAVAFLLWYTCVARIGAGRAGLLTGLAPISAAIVGMTLGGPAPRPLVWLGITTVAVGLGLGSPGRSQAPAHEPPTTPPPPPPPPPPTTPPPTTPPPTAPTSAGAPPSAGATTPATVAPPLSAATRIW